MWLLYDLSCDYCMLFHVTNVCFSMWLLYDFPCDYCMIFHVTIVCFSMWLLYDFPCDYCLIFHVTIVWFSMWLLYDFPCDYCMFFHVTISYFFLTKKMFKKSIYRKNDSRGNRSDPGNVSKVSIYNFFGLKRYKKGYIEMKKKFTLRLLRSVLGRSDFYY